MAHDKGGTAGTDQSNTHARSRDPDRTSTIVGRQAGAALKFANTSEGRRILTGIAATIAGLVLSRGRPVNSSAADAGGAVPDEAEKLGQTTRRAVAEVVEPVREESGVSADDTEADKSVDEMLETIHVDNSR